MPAAAGSGEFCAVLGGTCDGSICPNDPLTAFITCHTRGPPACGSCAGQSLKRQRLARIVSISMYPVIRVLGRVLLVPHTYAWLLSTCRACSHAGRHAQMFALPSCM